MMEDSGRKRSRSPATTPSSLKVSKISSTGDSNDITSRLLDSSQRNGALNELLRLSSVHDSNYVLHDSHLNALTNIFYECLDWRPDPPSTSLDDYIHENTNNNTPSFHAQKSWTQPPTAECSAWARYCQEMFSYHRCLIDAEKMKTAEAILTILRNLSFAR